MPDTARIMTVIGTRPEAIKMAPVHARLRRHPRVNATLLATGQHGQLFDDALAGFALEPDVTLPLLARRLEVGEMVELLAGRLLPVLRACAPDLVLVQGDTSSARAGAEAAAALGLAVGHVEAGLRSHDLARPWPEEEHRVAIDRLSTLLFAPGPTAMANLAADPAVTGACHLTGNSGIDALLAVRATLDLSPRPARFRELLVTLHRRETIGPQLRALCGALGRIAQLDRVRMTLPLHSNPEVRAIVRAMLARHPSVALVEPLSYPSMIAAMARATLILSDSGGIQEEAPALGAPLLILRDVTERPEAVECGAALLAGTDPYRIERLTTRLLEDPDALGAMARPAFPFGSGDASIRIMTVIENYLSLEKVTSEPISASGAGT